MGCQALRQPKKNQFMIQIMRPVRNSKSTANHTLGRCSCSCLIDQNGREIMAVK